MWLEEGCQCCRDKCTTFRDFCSLNFTFSILNSFGYKHYTLYNNYSINLVAIKIIFISLNIQVRPYWAVYVNLWYSMGTQSKLLVTINCYKNHSTLASMHYIYPFWPLDSEISSCVLQYEEVKCQSLCSAQLFATPWAAAHQTPLSMGFSRQGYWSGLPFPSPGDRPNPAIEPRSAALQADSLLTDLRRKPTLESEAISIQLSSLYYKEQQIVCYGFPHQQIFQCLSERNLLWTLSHLMNV